MSFLQRGLVMKKKRELWIPGIILLFIFCHPASGYGDDIKPYKKYFYNYPHEVPTDYVYRTSRLFSPAEQGKNFWEIFSCDLFGLRSHEQDGEKTKIPEKAGTELKLMIRELASQLFANSPGLLSEGYTFSVSTFVNLDNLYKTSSLGRYIGEQLIGELQRVGLDVLDIRKSTNIMIEEDFGEYGLSRDMKELKLAHPSQAMVVGTYSVTEDQLLINARILRNIDALVLSSAHLIIDQNAMIRQLLANESLPSRHLVTVKVRAWEKIDGRQD